MINGAFRDADRSWTIQRADVDNFYGSLFEADFVAMARKDSPIVEEALVDRDVARQFRPKFVLDGQVLEHYIPSDPDSVPEEHTALELNFNDRIIPYALKITPDEVEQNLDGHWEVQVEKDVSLAALVSLIKCAFLTLFHLLGYRYALSSGGRHIGRELLGDYFIKTHDLQRASAIEVAKSHFRPYSSVVRPVISASTDSEGTLTDGKLFVCGSGPMPWGLGVLIRFSGQTHTVIVPTLLDAESAATYISFLNSPFPRIEVRNGRFFEGRFEAAPSTHMIEWPGSAFEPLE